MRKTPGVKRRYKMGDGKLIQKADKILNLTARDAVDLQARGITTARVTALRTARDTFSDLPTDIELRADVSFAVEAKNTARSVVEGSIQTVRGMAEAKWGATGYYKCFGFDGLTEMTDFDAVRCGRRVARIATLLFSHLTSEGLTAALLATLKTQTAVFYNTMDTVEIAGEARFAQTQERVLAGNLVYEQLMKIAKAGQSVYANTNEACLQRLSRCRHAGQAVSTLYTAGSAKEGLRCPFEAPGSRI